MNRITIEHDGIKVTIEYPTPCLLVTKIVSAVTKVIPWALAIHDTTTDTDPTLD